MDKLKFEAENREKAEKLLKLVAENPELPVLPMVDYEVVGDDWGCWAGNGKIVISGII